MRITRLQQICRAAARFGVAPSVAMGKGPDGWDSDDQILAMMTDTVLSAEEDRRWAELAELVAAAMGVGAVT